MVGDTNHISVWKSKEPSDERIKPPAISDKSLALLLNHIALSDKIFSSA